MTQNSNVLFREIHKNAWLKKLPNVEKRNGAFPKKSERVWVVFCVHDDTEALLEVYNEQKLAVAHKPDWHASLNHCLHVSPTICPQEDEYEFVITLSSDVVRLAAPSWDIMMEWVETIRSKLQEMRILSPHENIYSKMPEARLPLAPTRDPNSPLPPTPLGPSARVPGIEPIHLDNIGVTTDSADAATSDVSVTTSVSTVSSPGSLETRSSSTFYVTQSEPPVYTRPRHVLNRAASVPESPSAYRSLVNRTSGPRNMSSNVTVIEVSANQPVPHSALPFESGDVFNFNVLDEIVHSLNGDSLESHEDSNQRFPSEVENGSEECVIPGPSRIANNHMNLSSVTISNDDYGSNNSSSSSSSNSSVSSSSGHEGNRIVNNNNNLHSNIDLNTPLQDFSEVLSHYECVFLPNSSMSSSQETGIQRPANASSRHKSSDSNAASICASTSSAVLPQTVSTLHLSSQTSRVLTAVESQTIPTIHPSTQTSRVSTAAEPQTIPTLQPSTQTSRVSTAVESAVNNSAPRHRGRSTSMSEGSSSQISAAGVGRSRGVSANSGSSRSEVERCLQPAPHPYRHVGQVFGCESMNVGRLTLREQQVLQLRREMLHPGGVRLQLRRKDCVNSIALVDAFGAVWVAGWKQKEHPMLYNALHIGDHLVSTGGVLVQNANDAQKLIRGISSLYVEFVIRRVPCGRVFAIRRETDGQSLGIIQEGNTAEIRDVIPGSPAACHGLATRAPTCDGLSLTNWVLTEINGRPLNLFFKDGEVRDRLNAVGRDISILVQPADLVKQLKKQLKSIRGYKDYIVQ